MITFDKYDNINTGTDDSIDPDAAVTVNPNNYVAPSVNGGTIIIFVYIAIVFFLYKYLYK